MLKSIVRPAMRAALVAAAVPLCAPSLHAYSPAGIVMTQLAPTDPGARRPTVCTEQYAPVCGRLSNVVKTYSNQCFARAAGAEVIAQGPCTGPPPPPGPR
jgi:Kazal-type serine protease inhibitor-like protein